MLLLFVFLGACFLGLALAAARAGGGAGWTVAIAATALAVWFGNGALAVLRRRR